MNKSLKIMNIEEIKFENLSDNPYNEGLFTEVKIDELGFCKPMSGGLWATLEGTNDWYDYCVENNFDKRRYKYSNIFTLYSNSNILEISSIEDLNNIMEEYYYFNDSNRSKNNYTIGSIEHRKEFPRQYYLDFEKLSKEYDGIYVHNGPYFDFHLYPYIDLIEYSLYGWDIASLLLFNKDCIKNIETKKKD